jgi:AAA domain/Bifunctional DNA primase/polymerase, N-terminal
MKVLMNIPVSAASVNNNHSITLEVSLPSETIALLKLGCKLFPCRPDTKLPAVTGWQDAATDDPAKLSEWLSQGFILGIYCAGSKFAGVDLDLKNDPQAWEWCHTWLSNAGFADFNNPLQFSRSGSPHFAFRVPDDWIPAEHGGLRTFKISDFRALKPGEKNLEIFSIRNRGLLIAAGSVVDGKRYTLPPKPTVHPWLPALGDALGQRATIEAPTHDAEAGLKNCTVAEVERAIDVLMPTGAFDVEQDWTQAIWQIKRSLGVEGWPLVEKISYADGQDLRLTKWNHERPTVADPYGAATMIKDAARVLKAAGLSDPIISAAEQRYNGAVVGQKMTGLLAGHLPPGPGMASVLVTDSPPMQSGQAPAKQPLPTPPVPPTAEEIEAERVAALDALPNLYRGSGQMVTGFVAPDYLIDGIFQRRFCYSHTAQTGVGKTAQDLRLAAHVATGQALCGIEVQKGTVLYLCGENPTDVQMRWIGLTHEMGLDPDSLDVHFTYCAHRIDAEFVERTRREVTRKGQEIALVVIDTAAAHNTADDENSNTQQGDYARTLRSFCTLPGGPCTLILCHPTKGAKTLEEMTPRGGGSFVNEVDGNVGSVKNADGSIVTAAVGKFRGPEFPPLYFALRGITVPQLVDSKGKPVPTVIAEPISYGEVQRVEAKAEREDDKVLQLLCDKGAQKQAHVATAMDWRFRSKVAGQPGDLNNKMAGKALKRLADQGLASETKGYWTATPKGQKYLNVVATAQPIVEAPPLAPANLGSAPYPMPTQPVTPPPMPPK